MITPWKRTDHRIQAQAVVVDDPPGVAQPVLPVTAATNTMPVANTADATKRVTAWIARFRPDVVVTEEIIVNCRNGEKAKSIVEAIAGVAADAEVYDVSVPRPHRHANKFAEPKALAERFPALRPWVPPPRQLWESEPRNATIFGALALAVVVVDREELSGDLPSADVQR